MPRSLRSAMLAPVLAFVVTSLLESSPLPAQQLDPAQLADSIQSEVIAASVRGDDERLAAARALAERAVTAYPDDPWLWHYLGFALYRLGVGAMDDPAGEGILTGAEAALERSAALAPVPETHALLASVYGLMIGRDPSRGATLGMRSGEQRSIAARLGPDNPRVWLLSGVGAYHTPEAYGGGAARALELLERAKAAFAADSVTAPEPRWGRADVHVWLGQVHASLGDSARARAEYEAALAIEPEHAWVRDDLLPALERGEVGHAH